LASTQSEEEREGKEKKKKQIHAKSDRITTHVQPRKEKEAEMN